MKYTRWNFIDDEQGRIRYCTGDHEKHEPCDYQILTAKKLDAIIRELEGSSEPKDRIYYQKDNTPENRVAWIQGLNASGYAGITSKGTIVDRREFNDAIPIQKNSMLGVVEPKPLSEEEEEVECNMCGSLMDYNHEDGIYECHNQECTRCVEQ